MLSWPILHSQLLNCKKVDERVSEELGTLSAQYFCIPEIGQQRWSHPALQTWNCATQCSPHNNSICSIFFRTVWLIHFECGKCFLQLCRFSEKKHLNQVGIHAAFSHSWYLYAIPNVSQAKPVYSIQGTGLIRCRKRLPALMWMMWIHTCERVNVHKGEAAPDVGFDFQGVQSSPPPQSWVRASVKIKSGSNRLLSFAQKSHCYRFAGLSPASTVSMESSQSDSEAKWSVFIVVNTISDTIEGFHRKCLLVFAAGKIPNQKTKMDRFILVQDGGSCWLLVHVVGTHWTGGPGSKVCSQKMCSFQEVLKIKES